MTESDAKKVEKMRSFISYYANCPCCEKNDVCVDGCTFESDDPNGYEVMQQAREALK